jgi:glycosyltransferase involved in cell wall biosynthesis
MRLLFATGYGHLPDVVGGLQTTLHELCLALLERGVEPTVLCGYGATTNRESATPRSDEALGYPVVRMPDPVEALGTVAAVAEPDAVLVLTGDQTVPMVVAALDTGLPLGVYIHNVEFREFGGVLLPDPDIQYLANSAFTARRLKSLFGLDAEVLVPLVQPERYRLHSSREKILFINPTVLKGVEVFFGVAERLPELSFRVAESWNLNAPWRDYCRSRAKELKNIEWSAPTRDPETLYGSARLLLMPSVWEESFGRSALEAQLSGIPVIASRRGGLPESVGGGGVIVEADADCDTWAGAVREVCSDQTLYEDLCGKASANASRVELRPDFIVATLLTALRKHIP